MTLNLGFQVPIPGADDDDQDGDEERRGEGQDGDEDSGPSPRPALRPGLCLHRARGQGLRQDRLLPARDASCSQDPLQAETGG